MVRLARPKHVTLPNGRSFKACFRRATRDELPRNVNFPQKYTQRVAPKGKRRRQRGRGFKSMLGKAFRLPKKVAGSQAFKNIAKAGVAELPGTIQKLWGKVKNKRLKSILDSDITNTGLDLAAGHAMDKLSKRIFIGQIFRRKKIFLTVR